MTITLKQAETIQFNENNIELIAVRDLFKEKKIIARIEGLPRPILLWNGEEEYNAAGNWTEETVIQRIQEVLQLPEVPLHW
jgi:hypothetical protein